MNKKFLIVFILIIFTLNFTGCSLVNKALHSEKPTNYFYTNGLLNSYNTERPKLITFFYSDLYKEKTLDKNNYVDVDNFLKSLKSEYFISKPSTLPEIPLYKIYIEFEKIKYVLNVYNETYVSIYPWDGKYDMDFIDMSTIPINYNIYGICKYYLPD